MGSGNEPVVTVGVPLALLACLLFVVTGIGLKQLNQDRPPIWIHESSIVALFGLFLGGAFKYLSHGSVISFDSNLFFYLVLPPIIFSAGYSLKRKKFFRYGISITVFGIFGTIMNFVLISIAARLFALFAGIQELSWSYCMLLGMNVC
jgi:NhaP-type Na+/H+ or K+/H+ antiporter